MNLNYKQIGEKGPPLIILHGLFGMLDNWQNVANQLSIKNRIYAIDLRNHGRSPHEAAFNYEVMSEDILSFAEQHQLTNFSIIGHSMGGKVAMKFAQNHPEFIDHLIVVDIAPKYYPMHHDVVLDALESVDFSVQKTRKEVEAQMKTFISEEDTLQFLLKNLYWKEKDTLAWRFNLASISKNMANVGEETSDRLCDKPTLFIRGANSNYILPEDAQEIALVFPNSSVHTVQNAGHWVHADQPEELIKIVNDFIQ